MPAEYFDDLEYRATYYAANLRAGDDVLDATDLNYVGPMLCFVREQLQRRGLRLVRRSDRWTVSEVR